MTTIAEATRNINNYIANLNVNIVNAAKSVDEQILNLNKKQHDLSMGGDGRALIHMNTGSPKLSEAYAKRTRKTYPDIYVNGAFRKEMFIEYNENKLTFYPTSSHELVRYLPINYPNLFGIAPVNQDTKRRLYVAAVRNDLYRHVFK